MTRPNTAQDYSISSFPDVTFLFRSHYIQLRTHYASSSPRSPMQLFSTTSAGQEQPHMRLCDSISKTADLANRSVSLIMKYRSMSRLAWLNEDSAPATRNGRP